MNTALNLRPGRLHLLVAPHPAVDTLTDAFIAQLALAGPVSILDGGNRFDIHQVARQIRLQTAWLDTTLERITIARAFTCYQMAVLLADQKVGEGPILVLNLLTTFIDENVSRLERLYLLQKCISNLKRLSARSPVLVSTTLVTGQGSSEFLAHLSAAADKTWRFEIPATPSQARLL